MNASEMKHGLKVHYTPRSGPPQNGKVLSWNQTVAWVVYKCNDEWDRFNQFTGCATGLSDLGMGWIDGQASSDAATSGPEGKEGAIKASAVFHQSGLR